MNVQPSTTGNDPNLQEFESPEPIPLEDMQPYSDNSEDFEGPYQEQSDIIDDDMLANKDGNVIRTVSQSTHHSGTHDREIDDEVMYNIKRNSLKHKKVKPKEVGPPPSVWRFYCYVITFWVPNFVFKLFGMRKKERQVAWREKIGLISVILLIAAFVAYLTFGFTATVCDNDIIRIRNDEVNTGSLIINGRAYDLTRSKHPAAMGIPAGSNVLYPPVDAGGQDASFLFQNVNDHCLNVLVPKSNSSIPSDGKRLAYYMPCQSFALDGSTKPNFTSPHYEGYACHTSDMARKALWGLKVTGEVYFTWEDIKKTERNLVVVNGNVLDLDLINWIRTDSVDVPKRFYEIQENKSLRGHDISQKMAHGQDRQVMKCLTDIAKVGYVDSDQIGCIASKVVLYVSLVFIVGIVAIKFFFAVYFKWFVSRHFGADYKTGKSEAERSQEIEHWSDDMYAQGPVKAVRKPYQSQAKKGSIFKARSSSNSKRQTMSSQLPSSSTSKLVPTYFDQSSRHSLLDHEQYRASRSFVALDTTYTGATEPEMYGDAGSIDPSAPDYCVPQPPLDYQPFGFPVAHTICLVTAYSESVDGMRTTLDSIATTDYPNSHKLILVICDGLIKGSGNDMTTPEIAVSMMKDFTEDPRYVQPYSYVSVVSGAKRHNQAKVYTGFYKYDDNTMDPSKQQRVPMITVVKCGTPAEAKQPKPGNRGKRDSQIILMSFLQRLMFDERMTELEYEMFNGIWKITGIAPDFYEIVLMVDADTKVFPDSITHMVACMVKDPQIMGLCGETKIANKRDSWVSMIQVFEYFISHHQSKAFESIFGGVTCLPGCFCMYRIKAPKGDEGYWVPILANPDIVERYAENVVDTLHKKNLLLLGEDRFLSTLMLKTFPKRKQIFVPRAVCKTIVPNEFKVLLSQRRRWINSTVHNLMELVLVRDLCGVFCISMQFVVFIELVGTLVLPAAISFTIYVVVISIVKRPTPVLSLVLLALILGLPGILIVVTASRLSYVAWMLIYLVSLPLWNFVLPVNAYWKFDDFSWGDTRTISGGDKGGHDDAEGEFDSSQIVMRRWREFEREKRRFAPPQVGWINDEGINSVATSPMMNPASNISMSEVELLHGGH